MRILEPCCYHKQLGELVSECEKKGEMPCAHFFSYSDWDACQFLESLAAYAEGGTLCVAMIHLDTRMIETLRKLLLHLRVDENDKSKAVPYLNRVILVTQPGMDGEALNQREEVYAQLGKFIDNGTLTVCEDNIGFRCILAGNRRHHLVVQGSLNPQKSNALQMFTLTASGREYDETLQMFEVRSRMRNVFRKKKN